MTNMKKIGLLGLLLFLASVLAAEPMEINAGSLRLVLYPQTGGFALYALSDIGKNRYEPLFEDRNFASTSWFSVLSGGRVFKLAKRAGKPVGLVPTDGGAKFVFTPTDDFQVEQEFSFIKNPVTDIPDLLRIETRIENTSGKEQTMALKALFDTMLGEQEGIHFFTDLRNRISSETCFERGIDPDSVLISRGKNLALMFLLDQNLSNWPKSVYASNWDRLNTLTWTPEYIAGRSFNSSYSVNDSGLLFIWPAAPVPPNRKLSVTLVIGPYTPDRLLLLSAESAAGSPSGGEGGQETVTAASGTGASQILIKQLLDRIAEIESNPDSASDEELLKLNQALDVMLQKTKGQ